MEEERKQERSYELRSEKVRSIVGQIPSSLVRYGTTIIGLVLVILLVVAYFLPYKQVYSGAATIHQVPLLSADSSLSDSTDLTILLRFEDKRPSSLCGQKVLFMPTERVIEGRIQTLSSVRDTLERQESLCRLKSSDAKAIENQTVDFQIIYSSGNLLQKILGGL